jgi:cell division protein FtsQ
VQGRFNHLSPSLLASAAGIAPGERLFETNLEQIRERIELLPWVASVQVVRQWPAALSLRVSEREPVARWADDALLDSEGNVFRPGLRDLPADMPRLAAQDEHATEVLAAYREMALALDNGPLALAGLTLDNRGEWTAQTRANGGHPGIILRLGQDEPRNHLSMLQEAVTANLAGKIDAVAYVDLRYPNGFAVGWVGGREGGKDGVRGASREAAASIAERCTLPAGATDPARAQCTRVTPAPGNPAGQSGPQTGVSR